MCQNYLKTLFVNRWLPSWINTFPNFNLALEEVCLIALIEKLKSVTDSGKCFGALLSDLSKAFNCLPHLLLLAKLNAYGFSLSTLRLICSYLLNRPQGTKINTSYSSWEEILFRVLQESILGPLLFNIFTCGLFLILEEIHFPNYADGIILFVFEATPENVVSSLKSYSISLFDWFSNNQIKANPEKYHLLINVNGPATIKIREHTISNSYCQKLLDAKIDSQLKFSNHLELIIKKASQKVHVLARIMPYMCISKRKSLMNAFFKTQFSCCPLVLMCHSRLMNNKINRLYERSLRFTYNDKTSPFADLLAKDGSVTIHARSLQVLATEMFKVHKNMSTELMQEFFCVSQTHYNLRNPHHFAILTRAVDHGSESISNPGPRLGNLVLDRLKELNSISSFKNEIKRWQPEFCPCRLCKT